jgi:hypothetical protein
LGYTFWYIFSHSHTTTAWITIPLCFYNVPTQNCIRAPESVSVKIAGKRVDLRSLDINELAIHVNADQLHEGKNVLTLTPETIFLPESIKLVHYSPSNPTVELIKEQKLEH